MKLTNNHVMMYEPPASTHMLTETKLANGELIRVGDWVGSPDDLKILKILAARKNVFGNIVSGIPISIDTIKINLKEDNNET